MAVQPRTTLELSAAGGSRVHLQDDSQSLVSANAKKKDYNCLSTEIHSRIFTFLDLSDIAHCALNRQIRRVINSPYPNKEKLKQLNHAVWEQLSSLNRFGVKVNWRLSLRQEVALRKINRDLTREENEMQRLENAQPAMTLRAQTRLKMSLDASKMLFAVFAMTLPVPSTGGAINISGYTP